MKIATFNINGIKARLNAVTDWLDEAQPDVVLCQEIKSVDESFPREALRRARLQRRNPRAEKLQRRRDPVETPARGCAPRPARGRGRRPGALDRGDGHGGRPRRSLCGFYLPNGNPAPGPKYDYKLAWMDRLEARARDLLADEMPALMAGDYNVIPQAEDAAHPEKWAQDALYLPQTRAAFRRILNLGFTEAFRARTQAPGHYSFWDYQAGPGKRTTGSASTICC